MIDNDPGDSMPDIPTEPNGHMLTELARTRERRASGPNRRPLMANIGSYEYAIMTTLGSPERSTDGVEGGYQDDPNDPGNKGGKGTNFGLTQPFYDEWRQSKHLPIRAVKHCDEPEARACYLDMIWLAPRVNARGVSRVAPRTGVLYYDAAINQGRGWAPHALQELVGLAGADVDGWVGSQTLAALMAMANLRGDTATATAYAIRRMERYKVSRKYDDYGHAWRMRLNRICDFANLTWRWT